MKKLSLILVAILFLAIIACSSGGGSATSVLDSYTKSLKSGDTTEALKSVSPSAQEHQQRAFELMDDASKQRLADAMSKPDRSRP